MDDRMGTTRIGFSFHRTLCAGLSLWLLLATNLAYGQADNSQTDKAPPAKSPAEHVAEVLTELKQGDTEPYYLEQVARAHVVEAVPVLEEQFAASKEDEAKVHIASVLIRLGDKGGAYWEFLLQQATLAAENGAPAIFGPDAEGKVGVSPAFAAWARSQGLDVNAAFERAMYDTPAPVMFLAFTGDRRGIPVFRRALQSANFMIQIAGAEGLAKVHDNDSVPLILDACKNEQIGKAVAMFALVYFDDDRAQQAAEQYLPQDVLDEFRQRHARGGDPFAE